MASYEMNPMDLDMRRTAIDHYVEGNRDRQWRSWTIKILLLVLIQLLPSTKFLFPGSLTQVVSLLLQSATEKIKTFIVDLLLPNH